MPPCTLLSTRKGRFQRRTGCTPYATTEAYGTHNGRSSYDRTGYGWPTSLPAATRSRIKTGASLHRANLTPAPAPAGLTAPSSIKTTPASTRAHSIALTVEDRGSEPASNRFITIALTPYQGVFVGERLARPFGTKAYFAHGSLSIETSILKKGIPYSLIAGGSCSGPFTTLQSDISFSPDSYTIIRDFDGISSLLPINRRLAM